MPFITITHTRSKTVTERASKTLFVTEAELAKMETHRAAVEVAWTGGGSFIFAPVDYAVFSAAPIETTTIVWPGEGKEEPA